MPLNEFWHGDTRLLTCYQKAYILDKSYTAWINGRYNEVSHSIALNNGFSRKGKAIKYPDWSPPRLEEKPKITNDNIEVEFRKRQAQQAGWLHEMLKK